jgi:hypothetical protein
MKYHNFKKFRGGLRTENQQKFYAQMSRVAYGNTPTGRAEIMKKFGLTEHGWKLDFQLSNPDIAVIYNQQTKEVVYSCTGSRFKDKNNAVRDIRSDVGILFGTANYGKRITEVLSVVKIGMKKYKNWDQTLTGHSLGAYLAYEISKKTGIPAVYFNRGESPIGAVSEKIANIFRKKPKGERVHYTTNKGMTIDPLSISARLFGNDSKTIHVDKTSDDITHFLSHFGGGALRRGKKQRRPRRHSEENYAHLIYDKLLCDIVYPLLGRKVTYSDEIDDVGKILLGNDFVGVFASDMIPRLKNTQCCVLNLDRSDQSGSHWIAVYKVGKKNLTYDSFGRKSSKIIPSLKNVEDADYDVEQMIEQEDCGARSIAFLLVCKFWSPELAKLI